MSFSKTVGLAIALAMTFGGAHAQSLGMTPAPKPPLNLSDARISIGAPPQFSSEAAAASTNRTSVDHTFGPQQVTASVGYLCGLEPPSDRTPGPASTFGPISTFLGGKLTYAFK